MNDITALTQRMKAAAHDALPANKRLSVLPQDDIFDISLVEGEQLDKDITVVNSFNELASPERVLALVEALESAQRTIAEQDQRLINYATIATKNAGKLSSISEDKMRQEFEQWAELEGAHPWGYLKKQRNAGGGYSVQVYSYMWTAWKASCSELGIKCEAKGE